MNRYLVKLALKYITRARRRTILTFLMLSFGVAIYIVYNGMLEGFERASFKNSIEFETGHFKVLPSSFDRDRPLDLEFLLDDPGSVTGILVKEKRITGVAPRLQFLCEIDNGRDSTPVVAVGIDPAADATVFNLGKYLTDGGFRKQGVVLGASLMKDLGLVMGDTVNITFRDVNRQFVSLELTVSGIINSPYGKVNGDTVYLNLDEAREGLGTAGVSEIAVMTSVPVEDLDVLKKLVLSLEGKSSGLLFDRWDQQNKELLGAMKMDEIFAAVFSFFLILIGGIGIVNTMLMSVLEKQREIGTLKALGMEDRDVRNLFVFEGLVIGLLGSTFGVILGSAFNWYPAVYGIDWGSMMSGNTPDAGADYQAFMGVIKNTWPLRAYIISFTLATLAAVLASWYPAKKVMSMQPVDCLRTVQ